MKNAYFLTLCLFLGLFNNGLWSQKGSTYAGVHWGNTFAFWNSNNIPENIDREVTGVKNFGGGIFISHQFFKKISLGGSLTLSGSSFLSNDICPSCDPVIESDYEFKVKKFEVPLFFEWYFYNESGIKVFFRSGIQAAFVRSARLTLSDSNNGLISDENAVEDFNNFLPGFHAGFGIYKSITQRLDLGGLLAFRNDFIALHRENDIVFRGLNVQFRLNYRF